MHSYRAGLSALLNFLLIDFPKEEQSQKQAMQHT